MEDTKQLDLITYQSELVVNDISSADYGSYDCVARNSLGFDALAIVLNRTSRPDSPRSLRLVNVTSGSVTFRWVAGFDGGIGQTFRIRYRAVDGIERDPSYMYRDVYPTNATMATVGSLRDNTEYVFGVMASNAKGDSDFTADPVKVSTLKGTSRRFAHCNSAICLSMGSIDGAIRVYCSHLHSSGNWPITNCN